MKLKLIPLSINGNTVSSSTVLDVIERAYHSLYDACVAFARAIQSAAELVPEKFEDRTWMQDQLYHKLRSAEWDLENALDLLYAHDGLADNREPDASELKDWQGRSMRDRKAKRADFYAESKFIKQQTAAIKAFAKATRDDDGLPDPIISPWGWCGRQIHD